MTDRTDTRRTKTVPTFTGKTRGRHSNLDATIFPHTVTQYRQDLPLPLKPGGYNTKIGSPILVGALKGAPIFTLTLEERKTCPRVCAHWQDCYGNNMQWAKRYVWDSELRAGIYRQLVGINHKRKPFLLRLHVLGDFPDLFAVDWWEAMTKHFTYMHIFGFTAHPPASEVGTRIAQWSRDHARVHIRFSNARRGQVPVANTASEALDRKIRKHKLRAHEGFVVCPEQRKALSGKSFPCAHCGLCWETTHDLVWLRH